MDMRRPLSLSATSSNAFSTSAPTQAGNVRQANVKGRPALKLSKKRRVRSHKRPEPGERKALRKRIVLSNTNALEVENLEDFSPEAVTVKQNVGQMLALRNESVDALRAAQAFRTSQRWSYFRRPCTLLRGCTHQLTTEMEQAVQAQRKTSIRRMVVGEKGVGKSILLLQAEAWALAKNWVVISFPKGMSHPPRDLTSATTSYTPVPDTQPPQFTQKDYTAALLSRTAKTNLSNLSTLPVLQSHPALPAPPRGLDSLHALCTLGANDPDIAWPAFQALWSELCIQIPENDARHRPRPPVLLALDGLPWIARLSSYLAPSMAYVHAHDLALVQHFIACLQGEIELPNGGAVLAADTHSDRPYTPALESAIKQSRQRFEQMQNLKEGEELPAQPLTDAADPWTRVDERSLAALRGVETMNVPRLDKAETRALLEYFANSGMLRRRVTETVVGEVWTMAGGGVAAEVERVGVGRGIM
ncbi:MAG: hypothetical protein Q9162_002236 [Coniocarpon cinnabarinum]